ncbi:type I restriction-modification system subunit M [Tenacibaculum finnmarkense]|uniref:site-specific DNA-methyltransferase (adenine-specific) n=1 Tax=Tenacibaculum finnmarkense genomovar ulcerans TaxID=2781388 RepID=A0A2I2M878_9FLAO|nr:type I restriction-modification system subunit M [Tenacibaculum finnmarkense]MBE7697088.1 type I restriction-modification system subunit M [Tenacibaculum finnmarkense genomovar ulcerans]SOU88732.1 Type I restriction enzyme M protein [Tenacibaculum finnmarkense genomovar ulcerans]
MSKLIESHTSKGKLSKQDINNKVWKACDTFRGTIDVGQYKDYILTMLFIKYISDVNKEKKEAYEIKYKGNQDRIDRALKHERFALPEKASFEYLYAQRNQKNLGDIINIGLEALEDANRTKLEKVFRNIDYNSEANLGEVTDRNRRLQHLLKDFQDLDLRPSNLEENDVIGDAYEYLISNFAAGGGKKAGEFYTASEVSILLAKLVEPKAGDRIADPTCGSGSLLLKVAKEVGNTNVSLNGQEVSGSTYALARMNMFLHEMDNANIQWGDTINSPKLVENDTLMKFDVVVANPPFSLDKWGAEDASSDRYGRFHRGVPPKSKGDYAFITHMIETLNQHGKAGVILPHGVLFRGSSEGKIRKQLIDENLLKAVIGLPANLFFGTGIPASILIFDKNKGTNTDILFIDASNDFENGKNQNKLREEDVNKIYNTFSEWKTVDKYSYVATLEEIKENDYNLNIPRYVDTFVEEEPVNIAETQKEIVALKEKLNQVESQMEVYLNEMGY